MSPIRPWPLWLRLVVIVLIAAVLIAPLILWRDALALIFENREQVAAEIRGAGAWGPLVVIALVVAQTIVAPIPGQVVGFTAGYIYGFGVGLALFWVGQMLGVMVAMSLARYLGRPLVGRLVPANALERVDRLAARGGLRFFLLFFLIPGLPDDLASFAAGLTRLPLRPLLLVAAVGRTPGIAASVWIGASAEQLPWQVWAVGGGITVLAAFLLGRYGRQIEERLLRACSASPRLDRRIHGGDR